MQNNKASLNAIIYVRVSSKDQVDGSSLGTQQRICEKYALEKGYSVQKVFIEEGESAKTSNRTELNSMMVFVADKKANIRKLIVYKLDRLARQAKDHFAIKTSFIKHGVEIESATEPIDKSSSGQLMEGVLACIAEFDNNVRAERCKGGLIASVKDGRWVWQAPLGYVNSKAGKGKANILIDQKKAPLVREIFERIANGELPEDVSYKITQKGLRTSKGKPINRSYFHRLIRSKAYYGVIEKFNSCFKGVYEPLISEELFNQTQYMLDRKARKMPIYRKDNPDFPLRGLILCQKCGEKLTASWSLGRRKVKYPYYRCKCTGINIRKENMENLFLKEISGISFNSNYYELFMKILELKARKKNELKIQSIESINKEIMKLEIKRKQIVEKNLKSVYNDELTKTLLKDVDTEIIEKRIELKTYNDDTTEMLVLMKQCKEALMDISGTWSKLNLEAKRKFQWFLFPEGLPFNGKEFGTPKKAYCLQLKQTVNSQEFTLVEHKELNWNQLVLDFKDLAGIITANNHQENTITR